MALKTEYAGTWEDAEGKISSTGFLKINKENLKLRLIGLHGTDVEEGVSLGGELAGTRVKPFEPLSINRQIQNLFTDSLGGKHISLFGLSLRHSSSVLFASPEETYYEFEAKYGLFGDRVIKNESSPIFSRSRFHISDLHLISSGNRFEYEYNKKRRTIKSINILRKGSSDVFRIPENNIRIELYNGYHEPISPDTITVSSLTTLTIISRKGLTYDEHLKIFYHLDKLISFMRGGPTNIENVFLNTKKTIQESKRIKIYEEFELISPLNKDKPRKGNYIIRLKNLENRSEIIHTWMTRNDNIPRLATWFNYLWQNTEYLVETQLVEYVSLLEILSTSNERKGKFLEKSEFKSISAKLKASLPETLPDDTRKIFESYIDRMNTKSQRLAIASYIKVIWGHFQDYTNLTLEDFSKALTINRNNISHGNFDSSSALSAKDIKAIFYLKEFAKYITYGLIALEIGIKDIDIEKTILEEFRQRQYGGKLNREDFY